VNEHSVFIGYRWLAWGLAGLLIVNSALTPRNLWLLSLTALINLALTIGARPYVALIRRYPPLIVGELLLGLGTMTLSGGLSSPFQVYAYGALVLPALLWGWRGSLLGALVLTLGNAALLWAGNTVPLPALLAGQAETWLGLLGPLSLAILLPLVRRSSDYTGRGARRVLGSQQRSAAGQRPLREVQDSVVQHLTAVSRPPTRVPERAVADEPATALLSPARTAAEQGSQELRRVVFGPLPAGYVAFDKVLYQLVASFGRYSSVATRLSVSGQLPYLPPVAHGTLVRLAQEALLNVEQHARAHSALVTLRCEPRQVILTIQDDGVGLLDGTYARPGLHALRLVSYRLSEIGGRLEVRESESGGLTVQARVPLGSDPDC
jgi:glucose-6-phosphate-specific signal transduction histidine kinase